MNQYSGNDIAFCIPTYNRSIIIQEFCDELLDTYFEYGIDVYIYDSSEDDETQKIIAEYMGKYENLYYIRINSRIDGMKKAYMIFQKYGLNKEYKYLWMCGDSLRYDERSLNAVITTTQKGNYDLIIVDALDPEPDDADHVINDKNVLFSECGPIMTLFGAVIIRMDTFDTNVDWNEMEKKYMQDDSIYYSHVGFYFEQLNKMKTFTAIHCFMDKNGFRISKYKSSFIIWKRTFYFYCETWYNTVMKLPDEYKDKKKVIKLMGEKYNFNDYYISEYKIHEVLNVKSFFRYYDRWETLTDYPRYMVFMLAILPTSVALKMLLKPSKTEMQEKRSNIQKLYSFVSKRKHIYLYGAGQYGLLYENEMKKLGIHIDGFTVTKKMGKNMVNSQLPIISIDEINDFTDVGFIIATGKSYREEITRLLSEKTDLQNVFSKQIVLEKEWMLSHYLKEYRKLKNDKGTI